MSSGCGDVLSLADLQTAKKHQIFEAEVITGKSGGVATGADIDYATIRLLGRHRRRYLPCCVMLVFLLYRGTFLQAVR